MMGSWALERELQHLLSSTQLLPAGACEVTAGELDAV